MPFTLRDIPETMRSKGFANGAKLMDRWFAGEAWAMTLLQKEGTASIAAIPDDKIDDTTIKMKWVRSFARIELVHSRLMMTWSQPHRLAASARGWQRRYGIAAGQAFRFGDLAKQVREIEVTCQINRENTGGNVYLDSLDDFFAAIGRGLIKIAATGIVEPLDEKRYRLTIDKVGTYLRDTYDFNGDQLLGFWSRYSVEKVLLPLYRIPIDPATADNDGEWDRGTFYKVDNGSFNEYRRVFGKGRDFFVHSDVLRTKLTTPVVVEVSL